MKKLTETLLREKEDFCSSLNMESITDGDFKQMKRVSEDFETEIKYDLRILYVQSNKFVLPNVFEKFRNICHKIYELELGKNRIRTINRYLYM